LRNAAVKADWGGEPGALSAQRLLAASFVSFIIVTRTAFAQKQDLLDS
jgi:hypothetical protein